jgi:KEOPS complex subunit Pcc1
VHRSELLFEYATVERARTVERAVAREAGDIDGERTAATVSREGDCLTVELDAADLTALRAGQNTWCSLVSVAERTAGSAARRR